MLEKQVNLLEEDSAFYQRRNRCLDDQIKRKDLIIREQDEKLSVYRDHGVKETLKNKASDLELLGQIKSLQERID